MGYSLRLAARVLLYASSHGQDNTYHSILYTSCGALAGTINSSMGPPHEGSIRWPIAPWANALTTELHHTPSSMDRSDTLHHKPTQHYHKTSHSCWTVKHKHIYFHYTDILFYSISEKYYSKRQPCVGNIFKSTFLNLLPIYHCHWSWRSP